MKAGGNGDKAVCVQNLLAIMRGEVCFDRLRGLDPRIVDRPAGEAVDDAVNDARWELRTYEPRAVVENITAYRDGDTGDFRVNAEIS